MAKKALIEKQQAKPKFKVRGYTRCRRCGRPRSVYRKFGLCRICLRELVHAGEVLCIPAHMPHKAEALEDTVDLDVFNPPRADWINKTDQYLRGQK